MASLYVSGDADHRQGVDAREAEEQREEAVHLDGEREKDGLVVPDVTSSKYLWVVSDASGQRASACLMSDLRLPSLL